MQDDSILPTIIKNNTSTKYYFDKNEIARAFNIIQINKQDVHEVRLLKATTTNYNRPHILSGYFNNSNDLIKSLHKISSAMGIFITLNPCLPSLLCRSHNRLTVTERGLSTKDSEIVKINWLPLDFDAVRPAGISSSDAEHMAAHSRLQEALTYLRSKGIEGCMEADSGNGAHGPLRIDLQKDDAGLVSSVLQALSARFSDDVVKLDTSVGNPARIWKLYGTLACKGDSLPERPHRLARILSVPEQWTVTNREALEAIASELPGPKSSKATEKKAPPGDISHSPVIQPPERAFDLDSFIVRHNLQAKGPDLWQGGRRWTLVCPWRECDGESAFLLQFANGAISAGCQHDTCPGSRITGNHWSELKCMLDANAESSIHSLHGAELDAALAQLPQTEYGLAERFRVRFGDGCRYVEGWKAWMVFDGVRWVLSQCAAQGFAMDTIQKLQDEARHLEGQG